MIPDQAPQTDCKKFVLVDENRSIYDDDYDLLEQDRKDVVFGFVDKKVMPSQADVVNRSYLQSKYFLKLCELTGFEEGFDCFEESEVSSYDSEEEDETAKFMQEDDVLDDKSTQELGASSLSNTCQ
jgi:hypothetical protein